MGNEKCPLLESLLSNFRQSITSFFLHFGISGKRLHDRATIVASVSGLTAIVNFMAAHPNAAGVQLKKRTMLWKNGRIGRQRLIGQTATI
jgi:hypothetical protein